MITKLDLRIGADYQFEYTNHRGHVELRTVQFLDAEFGMVEPYYPTPRLLFDCWDYGRKAERSFDPTKINFETWRKLSVSFGE